MRSAVRAPLAHLVHPSASQDLSFRHLSADVQVSQRLYLSLPSLVRTRCLAQVEQPVAATHVAHVFLTSLPSTARVGQKAEGGRGHFKSASSKLPRRRARQALSAHLCSSPSRLWLLGGGASGGAGVQ